MRDTSDWKPTRWAVELTKLLDVSRPADRFRFDIADLTMQVSRHYGPKDPITSIADEELSGCEGVLFPAADRSAWGIMYAKGTSEPRRRFTIAHELGHWLMHRKQIGKEFRSTEAAVQGRSKLEIEREANQFASMVLMPLNDFRAQIHAKAAPTIDDLSQCAKRYGVSFTAAALQWLRYTERPSLLIVSRDGYVRWCWGSQSAYQARLVISSKSGPREIPRESFVGQSAFDDAARVGLSRPIGAWFDCQYTEMAFRSERLEQEFTLLHFGM